MEGQVSFNLKVIDNNGCTFYKNINMGPTPPCVESLCDMEGYSFNVGP
jgi:hypothetical protein